MNLILEKTTNILIALEIINDKTNFKYLSNFIRSVYAFKILTDVMYCHFNTENKELCTKEYLTKKVSRLASRATIINFINDQISIGTLNANTSLSDGRIKLITPNDKLIEDYKNWLQKIIK